MANHGIPKQFIELCGKPIIIRTIEKMLSVESFDYLFIAIHPDYTDYLKDLLNNYGFENNSKIKNR